MECDDPDVSVVAVKRADVGAGVIEIAAMVKRTDFEAWIAEDLAHIEGSVDSLIAASGIAHGEVDMVFLTGGSSFVPAVRRIFESRFGAARIRTGNEFTSVARGLAVKAADLMLKSQ